MHLKYNNCETISKNGQPETFFWEVIQLIKIPHFFTHFYLISIDKFINIKLYENKVFTIQLSNFSSNFSNFYERNLRKFHQFCETLTNTIKK